MKEANEIIKVIDNFHNLILQHKAACVFSDNEDTLAIIQPKLTTERFISSIYDAHAGECDVNNAQIVHAEELDYGYCIEIRVDYTLDGEEQNSIPYKLRYAPIY